MIKRHLRLLWESQDTAHRVHRSGSLATVAISVARITKSPRRGFPTPALLPSFIVRVSSERSHERNGENGSAEDLAALRTMLAEGLSMREAARTLVELGGNTNLRRKAWIPITAPAPAVT